MGCDRDRGIDLHIHSTASDGTLTPAEIIETASAQELGAIAITDHDTIDGSRAALRLGIPTSLEFISGVELSAAPPSFVACAGSFHILGYGVRLDDDALNHTLQRLQQARINRNPEIVKRLRELGVVISMEDVAAIGADDGQLGRPHIARVLVEKGYARSIDDAFDSFLGHGKPAYVDKFRISCRRALETIRGAGGIAVLAHPFLLSVKDGKAMEKLILWLTANGLEGLEAYYPEHPPAATAFYEELARRHGLLVTGGTDFHGGLKPENKMGCGTGDFFVPFTLYEKLKSRIDRLSAGNRALSRGNPSN